MTPRLSNRVYPRGIPKELAGVPVTRERLEFIKRRVDGALPVRPLERPMSDLLALAYMLGVKDAVGSVNTANVNRENSMSDREMLARLIDHEAFASPDYMRDVDMNSPEYVQRRERANEIVATLTKRPALLLALHIYAQDTGAPAGTDVIQWFAKSQPEES